MYQANNSSKRTFLYHAEIMGNIIKFLAITAGIAILALLIFNIFKCLFFIPIVIVVVFFIIRLLYWC